MKPRYEFKFDCTNIPRELVDDLSKMVDTCRDITWDTFIKHIPWTEVRDQFPFYSWRNSRDGGLHIKDDYAVNFCKGKLGDKRCYFIQHSAIEYMWVEVKEVP